MILPNYNECITNIPCSILKYYGLPYKHNTIKEIDDILEKKKPKDIIVILYDGMGHNILNRTLNKEDFLIKNEVKYISSVTPATTTAATTSILSGMNPNEHGWLGWDLYIKPINKIITLFKNTYKDTYKEPNYNVTNKYYSYKNIIKQINEIGIEATSLYPFGENRYKNLKDMKNKVLSLCANNNNHYIYVYYDDPDKTMHEFGTDSDKVKEKIKQVNIISKELCDKLDNAVVIITADHGHINSNYITICDNQDFYNTLDGDIWIEGRLCSFKVKENKNEEFIKQFNKYYSNDFILKTKEEVIKMNLFGIGENHHLFVDSLGDYIALAIGNKYFRYNENSVKYKSMHAGITEDEMLIPLIIWNK